MNDDENNNDTQPSAEEPTEANENTAKDTRFKPGQSGNPKGRPKQPRTPKEVKELARQHTVQMVEVLANVANNKKSPPASRVAAAEAILARGWGRAPTTDLEAAEGLIVQILKFNNPQLDDNNMKTIEGSVEPDDDTN